jgi:hypothetical protein
MKNILFYGIILILASCGSNESESITSNESESITSNESESITSNESESITSNESESITSNFISSLVIPTVKIGNLEVMTEDLGKMKWDEAMKACADLGDGWRLPTKDDLNVLYENKDKIGGFTNLYYWSSTEDDSKFKAWRQGFNIGNQNCGVNKNKRDYYVRAVRTF